MQTETKQTAAELRFKELTKQIEPYLEPVFKYVAEASDGAFNGRFKVMFGSGGPKVYFFELCRIVRDSFGGFNPSGFEDHIAEVSAEVSAEAEQRWKWINDTVHDHVVSVLEENWGDDFFQAAISNKNIKADCYTKMKDDPPGQQKSLEVYLDFIDLKSIIEQKDNWPLFEKTLNIQLPEEKKGRAKYLEWFDKLNRIRRVFAHSYGRKLEESDMETLAFVEEKLREKLPDYVSAN